MSWAPRLQVPLFIPILSSLQGLLSLGLGPEDGVSLESFTAAFIATTVQFRDLGLVSGAKPHVLCATGAFFLGSLGQ